MNRDDIPEITKNATIIPATLLLNRVEVKIIRLNIAIDNRNIIPIDFKISLIESILKPSIIIFPNENPNP